MRLHSFAGLLLTSVLAVGCSQDGSSGTPQSVSATALPPAPLSLGSPRARGAGKLAETSVRAPGAELVDRPARRQPVGVELPLTALTTSTGSVSSAPASGYSPTAYQSLGGGGNNDLNVLVVRSVLGSASCGDPVPGAQVFVRGTDASSSGGLTLTTDSLGVATFAGVSGPFEITAWDESLLAGPFFDTVFREASTVIDVTPPTGDITMVLAFDTTDQPFVPDATLSGAILGNAASCPLIITVVSEGDPTGDEFFVSEDGQLANYSFPVPSGLPLEVSVSLACGTGTTTTTAAGYVRSIAPLTPGEMRIVDVDVTGPDFTDFNVPVAVTYQNQATAQSTSGSANLLPFDPQTGLSLSSPLFSTQNAAPPTTWDLPLLDAGAFAGFDAALAYSLSGTNNDATGFSQAYAFGLMGATPSALNVDLLPLPQLLTPAHPSQVATANDLPLTFTVPPTPSGLAGYEQIGLTGFKLGTGFPLTGTTVAWSLYAPEGTTSVVLPSVADQIMEDDTLYTLSIGSFRTDGPIDYDDFFATAEFICPPLATATFPALTAASSSNYTLELGNAP